MVDLPVSKELKHPYKRFLSADINNVCFVIDRLRSCGGGFVIGYSVLRGACGPVERFHCIMTTEEASRRKKELGVRFETVSLDELLHI
mgnify:CR=1 FL=1